MQDDVDTRNRTESPVEPDPVPDPSRAASTPPRAELAREVRLGLVLYGGVSLAIYINGVTQEFARAVRGQRGYRLIKALTDSDVVVDVVSGTSAGGINGIALSFALCNGYDLASLPRLWREDGDISGLLNSPNNNNPPINSLLSGDAYHQKLRSAFESLAATPFEPEAGSDGYISPVNELDMFVTGTYLDGFERVEFDDRGHAIRVEDHRAQFKLKYRQKRDSNPDLCLDEDDPVAHAALIDALAKLSRLTSGFPGAFPPIRIRPASPERPLHSADGLLHRWGQLPVQTDGYFVDGGVLDNKPFTSTLEAIFSRAANRDVNRLLFFVEPDPAEIDQHQTGGDGLKKEIKPPNIVSTLIRSRIDIPFVETITDDLKRLSDHNRGVALYNRIATDMRKHWYDSYRDAPQDEKRELAAHNASTLVSPEQMHIYEQSRLVEFSQRIASSLYNARTPTRKANEPEPSERAAEFIRYFDANISPAGDQVRWLLDNDIYFYRRRVYYMIYLLHGLQFNAGEGTGIPRSDGDAQPLGNLRLAMNRQSELYEVIRGALTLLLQDAPPEWVQASPDVMWRVVRAAGECVLDRANAALPEDYDSLLFGQDEAFSAALTRMNSELQACVKHLHTLPIEDIGVRPDNESTSQVGLITRLVDIERNAIQQTFPDDDRFEPVYDAFEKLDAALYPLEVVGQLGEKDNIEIVRISAIDAQRGFSERKLEEKLSGDSVMHFGGFFKRSWRSNDILWGRLDGCCQLMECLLEPERVKQVVQNPTSHNVLRERFFDTSAASATTGSQGQDSPSESTGAIGTPHSNGGAATNGSSPWRAGMRPSELYPHSGARTGHALDEWIRSICDGTLDVTSPTWKQDFEEKKTLMVEAEQLEILYEEVPNVIGDSLAEQEMWNRFEFAFPGVSALPVVEPNGHAPSTNGQKEPRYKDTGGRRLDPFVAITAAAQYVYQAADTVFQDHPDGEARAPADTRMGMFFKTNYKVGSEHLTRDIPTVTLLGIMARALLVLQTCLLNMFGDSVDRVRHSLIYRIGLDLPLRAFYGFTILWRRWAGARIAILAGIVGLSILMLALGIWLWEGIVAPDGIIPARLIAFIVVPSLVLFILLRSLVLGWALTKAWTVALYAALTIGAGALLVWSLLGVMDALDATDINWTSVTTIQFVVSAIVLYTATRIVFWKLIIRFTSEKGATGD